MVNINNNENMEEKWKKYNEKYQVSNFGRIKSLNYRRTGKEKVLHPTITHNGYLIVKIEGKTITINRLVGLTFIQIPENLKHIPIDKLEVDYIDGNPLNNKVCNIRWTDHKMNMKNPITRKHMSVSQKGKKMPPLSEERKRKLIQKIKKPVLQIDINTNNIISEWKSLMEIQRNLGFSCAGISFCCNGKRKTAYGYKWQFKCPI